MAIKIIVDKTEATADEIKQLNEIFGFEFESNQYHFDKAGIEILILTDKDKDIAKDNGYTIRVGLEPNVIMGYIPREIAENMAKEK